MKSRRPVKPTKLRSWLNLERLEDRTTPTTVSLVKNVTVSGNTFNFNNELYFVGDDGGGKGFELWRSNGTDAGTKLVKDIRDGDASSNPSALTSFNGSLFFVANDGVNGAALYSTDGTEANTKLVKAVNNGSSGIGFLTVANSKLFFTANDGVAGNELWASDGTEAGTVRVKDIYVGGDSDPSHLTSFNGKLYFTANDGTGRELWMSDGTEAGTEMVLAINPGNGSNPSNLTIFGGALYFQANDGTRGAELWKSDGTAAGTDIFKDINAGDASSNSNPELLTVAGSTMYFRANNGTEGQELWKTDGTPGGTAMVKDIQSGAIGSSPNYLTNVNGTIYFAADDGVNGNELWRSDGTAGNTVLVHDINSGAASASPNYLTNVNDTLFFTADNGSKGVELWKSDANGTVLVDDLNPDGASSDPYSLVNVNGTLFFGAVGVSGAGLYKATEGGGSTNGGVVTFSIVDDMLTLTGDGHAAGNGVRITATASDPGHLNGNFIIEGLGDTVFQTLLGKFAKIDTKDLGNLFKFENDWTDNLTVNFKGGNDTFIYDGFTNFNDGLGNGLVGSARKLGVVTLNLGAGDDTVIIKQVSAKGLKITSAAPPLGGTDNDSITFAAGGSLDLEAPVGAEKYDGGITGTSGVSLDMNLGTGVDNVVLALTTNGGVGVKFAEADGDSLQILGGTKIAGSATVAMLNMNAGEFKLNVLGNSQFGDFNVDCNGHESLIANMSNFTVTRNLTLSGGPGGASTFNLSHAKIGGGVLISGGDGQDSFNVDSLTVGGELNANMSGGHNVGVLKDSRITGNLTLTTYGNGNDKITVSTSVVDGSVTINDGIGADSVSLDSVTIDKNLTMTLLGGANTDVVKNSLIRGSLTTTSGDGVDSLIIQYTNVRGSATITNGKGADRLSWVGGTVGTNLTFNAGTFGNKGEANPDELQLTVGGNLSVTYTAGGSGPTQFNMNSCYVGGIADIKGASEMGVMLNSCFFNKSFTYGSYAVGMDTISLDRCSVNGTTSITTGSDNDVVNLSNSGQYKGKVTISTGGALKRLPDGSYVDHDEITINAADNVNEEIIFHGGLKVDTGIHGSDKFTAGTTNGVVAVTNLFEYLGKADDTVVQGPNFIFPGLLPVAWSIRVDGALEIIGNDSNNVVYVGSYVKSGVNHYRIFVGGVAIKNNLGRLEVLQSDVTTKKVYFTGNGGNDSFSDWTGTLQVQASGGAGNDTLYGGEFDDQLAGDSGDDKLYGRGGNDTIFGGTGNDYIEGGDGQDTLLCGLGDDTAKGGAGADYIDGSDGADRFEGGADDDTMFGGAGNDVLFGGAGNDTMNGEDGNDFLDGGGEANDWYNGGKGNDLAANQWVINGAFREDVIQQQVPSCWFLAALCATADKIQNNAGQSVSLADRITYLGDGQYSVTLYNVSRYNGFTRRNGLFVSQQVEFTGAHWADVAPRVNGDVNADNAACEGEFWVTLFERAMLRLRASQQGRSLNYLDPNVVSREAGGYCDEGFRMVGVDATRVNAAAGTITDAQFTQLRNHYNSGLPIIADFNGGHSKLVNGVHSYELTEILANVGQVRLYNPWGRDGNQIEGADDGYVTLTFEEFRRLCVRFALGQKKERDPRP
jgi:ELWxxDGT repeat protein